MVPSPAPVDRLRELLSERPDVQTVWLFGSMATGAARPDDADLAVIFVPGVARDAAVGLQSELESDVDAGVDLHDFERLPVDLQFRVLREGRLLVDNDPAARVRREIRTLNAFNDFKPYLDRLRAATRNRLVAKGGHG